MPNDSLWKANADLVRACLRHPFVEGLADGTLAPELFRNYVAQDAFFLDAFAKAYCLAQARSSDPEIVAVFAELADGVRQELKLHQAYSAELGIDLGRVTPNGACSAYTEFLTCTAEHGSLGETVASLTPCMSLYAYLGEELASRASPRHPYRKWIETYSSSEFGELARRLESVLDCVSTDNPEVRAAYRYALQCELTFFAASMGQ